MNIENNIQEIKDTFSILQTAEMLGLDIRETNGTQVILCPAHEDKHPSLVIMPKVNRVECKSCGWKGDVIDLVQKVREISTSEAIDFFIHREKKPMKKYNWNDPYTYLANRGITEETAKHFGLELKMHQLLGKGEICRDCGKLGVPTVVAIPIIKSPTEIRYKFRAINPQDSSKRYWGDRGYGSKLFKTADIQKGVVILSEGEFDAMVIWQHTGYTVWTITTGATTDLKKFIEEFEKAETIYLAYDNDLPGEEGADKAAQMLGKDRCYRIVTPEKYGKDWTEFFLKGGTKEEFNELIKNARSYKQDNLLEAWMKQQDLETFIVKTGVSYIDNIIGGFRSSNAYILGGLEKSGKSSLLMNFLDSMLKDTKYKVGYINTEFTLTDFVVRMAAIHFALSKEEVEKDIEMQKGWIESFSNRFFYTGIEGDDIKENTILSFPKTMAKLQEFCREGMQVLFFDNITSYSNTNSKKQNWETLSACISELVNLSKAKNIVVIMVLHQKANTVITESAARIKKMIDAGTPRDIFGNDITHVRKPTLSDLFGGGTALSQVSGTIFVWRPYQKFFDPDLTRETQIIMESFRHSEGGESRVFFNGEIGSFEEEDRERGFEKLMSVSAPWANEYKKDDEF